MTLRVIAGEYGGRLLKSVRGVLTRPLLGQVREALFNILGARVEDAEVWDLFAGTGATGIEALSRGARRVTFVEKSNQALAVLGANLELLGQGAVQRSRVLKADAWQPPAPLADDTLAPAPDLVFLDPPYASVAEDPARCAYRAARLADLLNPGGALCFHFPDGMLDSDDFEGLDVDLRRWGRTAVAILHAADCRQQAPRTFAVNRRE
jgi:16S rRNA (guanine966-N2)-methyltransferase